MEVSLHIERVDPDDRWNRVQEVGGALCRFISCRDDATFAWFGAPNGSGIRMRSLDDSELAKPEDFRALNGTPFWEIRQYKIKPGQRTRFEEFFRSRAVEPLRAYGMLVHGRFEDLDDPDNFVWLRGFPDIVERDRRKAAFYGSKLWLEEMQDEAFSMIEDYTNVLLVAPVG